MLKKILSAVVIFTAISSCKSTVKKAEVNSSKELNLILDNFYEEKLKYNPIEATQINDLRYNDTLTIDISVSYRNQLKAFFTSYLEKINQIDTASLKENDYLSYQIFKYEMNIQLEALNFKDYLMPINQFWGFHLTFAQLGSGSGIQPFKNTKQYEDFLKRVDDFTQYIDTAIANMRQGLVEGIMPPSILMAKVLPQLKGIITDDPVKSVFYMPVTNFPDSVSLDDQKRLTGLYVEAIQSKINPSYQKLYDFISKEYMPKCRTKIGITEITNGKEYYAFLVKQWTTTNKTADEIFELGNSEVARIRSEMEKVKESVDFKGDLKAFFNFIHTNKQFMPFTKDEEVITAYKNIEKTIEPNLDKLFKIRPKTPFEVRQTEEYREASSSAEYQQGSPDGSRPGIFYVPVIDAKDFNTIGMEDLFLHEAIPGHHFQISLQQENISLPKFRRFNWYGAYGEGWALYCESLGKDLGLYTDPYQVFGMLSEEMHRAIRLVVDVGMHTKGWTREQAIKFSMENEAESERDITAEVERYIAIPGQALSYKIGQLKILELRERAQKALGEKFDIREFHDQVLKDGCLPLNIFEAKIDRWVASKKSS